MTEATFSGTGRDNLPARIPALGPDIDEVVGGFDHVEVVLDHDHGVALLHEIVEHLDQFLRIVEVEAGRRLVQEVEGPAGRPLRELAGELDPLRLAAREGGRALARA